MVQFQNVLHLSAVASRNELNDAIPRLAVPRPDRQSPAPVPANTTPARDTLKILT